MNISDSGHVPVAKYGEHSNETSGFVKGGKIFD
jgi:hypothetical protein